MRILHIAVENFAGIPMRLSQAERLRGHYSRLATLLTPHQRYDEDISLKLPLINNRYMAAARRTLRGKNNTPKSNKRRVASGAKLWQPANLLEKSLFIIRDALWKPYIASSMREIGKIEDYDVIIADGGHDFTRFPSILRQTNVPIVTCYYGSDLRVRGVIGEVQKKAVLSFTFEFDHTLLLPQAELLFYPYFPPEYSPKFTYAPPSASERIIVGHFPTNRAAKGTDDILQALDILKNDFPIEVLLIENVSHKEALKKKAACHLFIDQIGELGYGLNSVESAWMGIPTCVEIMPDYEDYLIKRCGAVPFYNIRGANLLSDLRKVFSSIDYWEERGRTAAEWAQKHHNASNVADFYLQKIEDKIRL